jgi:biofilm PGA synthesis N-glycosyltransferase PgaC
MMKQTSYALVTPARNEEAYIGGTIESVLSQTLLPQKWVIVSDGSTDRTDEIIESYAQKHSLIHLLRNDRSAQGKNRNFGSKALAFQKGYSCLGNIDFQFIGNLDADVTFEPDYFVSVLDKMESNPKLGVAGGIILELVDGQYISQNISTNSVAGAVQLFRRECYEGFGGYIPVARGVIDAAAEIMARMHGWEVQTFADIGVHHHRRVSTGGKSIVNTRFRQGVTNYLLGYHPLFQFVSSISRIGETPAIVGSVSTMLGYSWTGLKRKEKILSPEAIQFLRSEQMDRLRSKLIRHKRSSRP